LPLALALGAALLVGCAGPRKAPGTPGARSSAEVDGPGGQIPPDLWRVPDAEPRVELPRSGGPNKPYEVLGQTHVPLVGDPVVFERGLASWYGRKFHGRSTSSGEPYDMYAMTAAHKTMPVPSYARVRNPANGREVVVRVNDRGPFHADRVIDLSYTAALKLGLLGGVAPVEVERITNEAIRTGAWRRPAGDTRLAAAPNAVAQGDDPIADIALRVAAEPVALAAPAASADQAMPAGRGVWLQLGAFREAPAAQAWLQQLQRDADWLASRLTVLGEAPWHRVQAGPFANREEAQAAADRLRLRPGLGITLIDRR
jgi:rare lipoprotein A